MNTHWTEKSTEKFLSRITFDFITQLEKKMESMPMTQLELAEKLNVSEGRVSQILNNPSNLTIKSIIKYARALGLKVAIVAYDDDDPENTRGLINSEIFNTCWERQGKPIDFFAFEESTQSDNVFTSPKFATEPIVQPETSYYSRNYKTEVETENATSNTAVSISGVKNNQEKDKHPLWRLENKLYGK